MELWLEIVFFAVACLAGIGLISLGTRLLSEGLQLMVGSRIRQVMNWLNQSDSVASLVGVCTATLIQSRISSSVMAVSYAGSGLMNLRQMVFFVLGATFGTFLTPWVFVLDFHRLDLYLLALGILPMMHARWDKLAGAGRFVFALGLMLLGFDIIAFGAMNPDELAAVFASVFDRFPSGVLGLLSFMVLALPISLFVRSTVALVGLMMALVFAGIIEARWAVVLTIGFNVGAILPALMASTRSNTTSIRGIAYVAVMFVLSAFIFALGFEPYMIWLREVSEGLGAFSIAASLTVAPVLAVPLTHIFVNLLAMILGFAFSPGLEPLMARLILAPKKKQIQHLRFFGRPSQFAPSLALEQASQEVKKMSALIHTTLQMTNEVLKSPNEEFEGRALKYEGITDSILEELTVFLAKTMQATLSKKQSFEAACLMQFAVELEKIADHCQEILEYKRSHEISTALNEDILKYFGAALDCFEHVFPMLTDHFNISKDSMDSFLTDMQVYVRNSLEVYDELLLSGLKQHADYSSAIPVFNAVRMIVENTHSIVDLRQRFLLPEADLEKV